MESGPDTFKLAELYCEAIGQDYVSVPSDLLIDGLRPALVVRPGSSQEALECLRIASEAGAAVLPAGGMSWLEFGNPLRRLHVILSVGRLDQIVDFSPADLTVTAQAGVSIGALNAIVARERQWLPLDPPGYPAASIGAIVSCASSGPLRFGFGTPRDYVIGLKLAHPDGTASKSGGRVVKNVAGYDMNKLYTGSFGTLALITEITFKLRPAPEQSRTVAVWSGEITLLADLAERVLRSDLQPASLFLTQDISLLLAGLTIKQPVILVRFVESDAAVAYQVERMLALLEGDPPHRQLAETEAAVAWERVANPNQEGQVTVRVSVPLSRTALALSLICESAPGAVVAADMAVGIIRCAFESDTQEAIERIMWLRRTAAELGGTLFVENAPLEVRRQIDSWGPPGSAERLMRTIKNSFDPASLLSPGRFVSGI